MRERLLALVVLVAIVVGAVVHVWSPHAAELIWTSAAVLVLVPLTASVARSLLRRDVGVDAIALLAIAGAIALGEALAAVIVALMMSGGNALEESAARRARHELTRLIERAPRIARLVTESGIIETPVENVVPGDRVVVATGEVIPVDGSIIGGTALIDESALTGEPLPVAREAGHEAKSGTVNAGDPFELQATRIAADSAYAGIVRLVRAAQASQPPFVRMADRFAVVLLPATLVLAALAWTASGDPTRALAVLVVATPCPLILAAPIAFVSGLSRAASRGIIVKGGAVIERLGNARTVLFDKTGTLTLGSPGIGHITALGGTEESALRIAASLDQFSAHAVAGAIVEEARRRRLTLAIPQEIHEDPGRGVIGRIDGFDAAIGTSDFLRSHDYFGDSAALQAADAATDGRAAVFVGRAGRLVGTIVLEDHLRAGAETLVPSLRSLGIHHVAIVTGDRTEVAENIGREIDVDEVYAEQSPEEKLAIVRMLKQQPQRSSVVMVGDGINDAPALAVADVGIALGNIGATVSSETADVVITVDRIDRVVDAVRIGRRSLRIARQSVIAGMGLSFAAMIVAAAGYLPPVWGALLQEVIDIAVILNALRALRD